MKGNHHGLRQVHRLRRSAGIGTGCGGGGGDHTGHCECPAGGIKLGVPVNRGIIVDDRVFFRVVDDRDFFRVVDDRDFFSLFDNLDVSVLGNDGW